MIISACHSNWLAEEFANAGIQCVVGISASQEILETAAQDFNVHFISHLMKGFVV